MATAKITATPDARDAIKRAISEHGPIIFHTSGGRVGGRRFLACLPAGELRIGARDHLLGEVEGVPVYDMEDRDGVTRSTDASYVLDVADGHAMGFSISAAPGKKFTLNRVEAEACNDCA